MRYLVDVFFIMNKHAFFLELRCQCRRSFVVSGNDNASVQEVTGYGAHAYAACSYKIYSFNLFQFHYFIILYRNGLLSARADCSPASAFAIYLVFYIIIVCGLLTLRISVRGVRA